MAPIQHSQSLHHSSCFLGTLLVALVILLSTSSDACGRPPTFESMQLVGNAKPNYAVGERVEYACKPGYKRQFSLPNFIVCAANGWPPLSNDACYRKSCPRFDDPVNGRIRFLNDSTEFGSHIQFSCNEGFYLIGRKILRCLLQGSQVFWSGDAPQCEKILCEPPPTIKNGIYTPSDKDVFEYHEVVTYSCNPTSGPDQFSMIGERKIYCSGASLWNGPPPQCKVVKCPLPTIQNGNQISGIRRKYSYKDTAMFQCNSGFILYGHDVVVCEDDSTWKPPVPTCHRKDAPPPPPTKPHSPSFANSPSSKRPGGPPSKAGRLECKGLLRWIIALLVRMLLEPE